MKLPGKVARGHRAQKRRVVRPCLNSASTRAVGRQGRIIWSAHENHCGLVISNKPKAGRKREGEEGAPGVREGGWKPTSRRKANDGGLGHWCTSGRRVRCVGSLSVSRRLPALAGNWVASRRPSQVLEPYDGKLSRTVLRGERGARPLTYPAPSHEIDDGL